MGWSSGMSLLAQAWEIIEPRLKENDVNHEIKVQICEDLIDLFEDQDADDASYLMEYPEMVEALKSLHPEWDWEEEDDDIDYDDED